MTVEIGSNPVLKYGVGALIVVVAAGLGFTFVSQTQTQTQTESVPQEAKGLDANAQAEPVKVEKSKTRLVDGEADTTKTTIETLAGTVAGLEAKIADITAGNGIKISNPQQEEALQVEREENTRKMSEIQQKIETLTRELEERKKGNEPSTVKETVNLPQPGAADTRTTQAADRQKDLQTTLDNQQPGSNKSFNLANDEEPSSQGFTLSDIPNLADPTGTLKRKKDTGTTVSSGAMESDGDIDWIQPSDARKEVDPQTRKEVVSLPEFKGSKEIRSLKVSQKAKDDALNTGTETGEKKENTLVPVYTVPENSTLLGVTAATALIGRIPFNNTVSSPYPFQIVIGAKNLATNGIRIPNLKGMVVGGTATGDYTLRCVIGQINSVTYTFTDGTIRTISGNDQGSNNASSGSSGSGGQQSPTGATGGLGFIADSQGVPCVSGEYITNIGEYLAQTMAINGAAGAAEAFAQGQESITQNTDGSTNSVVAGGSSSMKYMAGKALGAGVQSGSDVLAQRQQGAYDAIYVQPGAKLEIHITKQLEIDYDKKGRKVSHVQNVSLYGNNRGLD